MLEVIEAPNKYFVDERSCFLAGGITDCPDWQAEVVSLLEAKGVKDVVLLNPRRANFDVSDPTASQKQIQWEHHALRDAGCILFWFPKETLCPIVLYELGAHSVLSDKPIFIGVDPGYERVEDVVIQTGLVRRNVRVVDSLEALTDQVSNHFKRL